tara:strand:- start:295 stop:540 length:246 start_codon:yes stop_codon:yes gene_type:complete
MASLRKSAKHNARATVYKSKNCRDLYPGDEKKIKECKEKGNKSSIALYIGLIVFALLIAGVSMTAFLLWINTSSHSMSPRK